MFSPFPFRAVIGGAELGAKRELFVKTPDGYQKKEVTLGLYNEKMVEIREGLSEGDEVVLNPKVILGDNKTKTRDAAESGSGDKGGPDKAGAPGDPAKKGKRKGGGPPKGL